MCMCERERERERAKGTRWKGLKWRVVRWRLEILWKLYEKHFGVGGRGSLGEFARVSGERWWGGGGNE